MYGGVLLPYYLHEETGWSLDINELREQTYKVPWPLSPSFASCGPACPVPCPACCAVFNRDVVSAAYTSRC